MAQPVSSVSVYKGRYHRTIGKVLDEKGQTVPKKFLLGTDMAAAEVANRLLEQLWTEVIAEHADAERFIREMGDQLLDCNQITGEVHYGRKWQPPPCVVWRAESLAIAEAPSAKASDRWWSAPARIEKRLISTSNASRDYAEITR